jgi:hypothetical protein
MKPPPLLLGAALLFWGWQTDFLLVGALIAVALESRHVIHARWELSEDDFFRIWTFSILLLVATLVYAFSANQGPADFRGFFQHPGLYTQRAAGATSARTVAAWIRWLPMVFFLLAIAQAFGTREAVPLVTPALMLRRRRSKARHPSRPLPAAPSLRISFLYFALCLFAASIHSAETHSFFWGFCGLLAWALWSQRSRRFGIIVSAGALASAIALGYFGQGGLGRLQHYLETFNPQWLSHLARHEFEANQSKTAIGQIGRLKTSGRIVLRLEPKDSPSAPALLREASFRTYKAPVWHAGSARSDWESILEETNRGTWLLLPGKTNTSSVNLASYLAGGKALLPLPTGTARLDNLWAYVLHKNSLGTVAAEGPGLVIFDARFSRGLTMDSPPVRHEDWRVPDKEGPALDQVISELQLKPLTLAPTHRSADGPSAPAASQLGADGDNPSPPRSLGGRPADLLPSDPRAEDRLLRAVRAFFQNQFTYSMWQEHDRLATTNETALARFLLRSRSGHCEYFATATVLLLRRLGIPARYAVGYAVHEHSGRKYVVRQSDAHSWCLVWNFNTGNWQDFDTTPGSWMEAEAKRASPLRLLSDLWSRIRFELAKLRWGQTRLRQYLLWALVPILSSLLYQIISRSRRQRQHRKSEDLGAASAWPGLDSEFYQLEKRLSAHGLLRQPSEPLSRWLSRAMPGPALPEVSGALQELLRLHYRYRFDPRGLTPADREALRREATTCLAQLARTPQAAGQH